MSSYVLDASAVLAYIHSEPGADVVWAVVDGPDESLLSTVNLAEVVSRLADLNFSTDLIDSSIAKLDLVIIDFDEAQARASGLLRHETRAFGLSLADRACLALAQHIGETALTADRAWSRVPGVQVEVFR